MLALNGKRKYYSVYHAAAELVRRRRDRAAGRREGAFMGMDEDSDSSWETEVGAYLADYIYLG